MSPEVNSKEKRTRNLENEIQKNEDNVSKFSDEKRSTLPLHSDSFKKHSQKVDYADDLHQEIIDTEKRNQNKEYRLESPHFLQGMDVSSSNPFMPSKSNAKSLQYDSTPQKDENKDSLEELKQMIEECKNIFGESIISQLLSQFIEKPKSNSQSIQCENIEITISQNSKELETENENLSTQLKLCKEANVKFKEKLESSKENSNTFEKLLRERESKILHYSTELENASLMETQLKKEIEMYKTQREEIEQKYKELKLAKGKETIQIRQLKSDIECKKREIIDASDIIERVTSELEEMKKDNIKAQSKIEKLEKERFDLNFKFKKMEREVYKVS